MTATFVDQFGFSNEEFAEQDNSVNAPFDRIVEINFSVDSPGAALFEACCSDHIQPFDKDDDLWEDVRVAQVTRARRKLLKLKESIQGFPGGAVVKNPPANAGDTGSSPGPGRSHMPQSN
ncbi:serine/threonine-protein phosphatase 6 regulatory subunit 2-like isoform X2 [Tursiops truncatus]|uniref:serine/threonine-protein phosphatase 6 regulatory subunit 2-like isoform X2 n=1 Tax=Tursiops truncatus TaxID=9739 RepID=UPI003CCF706D